MVRFNEVVEYEEDEAICAESSIRGQKAEVCDLEIASGKVDEEWGEPGDDISGRKSDMGSKIKFMGLCDTGATKHSTGDFELMGKMEKTWKVNNMNMVVVGEGRLQINEAGKVIAHVSNSNGDISELNMKPIYMVDKMGDVTLISNLELARQGWRSVFDLTDSYIEYKESGERIPLLLKEDGWYLEFTISNDEKVRYNVMGTTSDPVTSLSGMKAEDDDVVLWSNVAEGVRLADPCSLDLDYGDIVAWKEVEKENLRACTFIPHIGTDVSDVLDDEGDDMDEMKECGVINGRVAGVEEIKAVLISRHMLSVMHRLHAEHGHQPGGVGLLVKQMLERHNVHVPKEIKKMWECEICNRIYIKRHAKKQKRSGEEIGGELFSVDTLESKVPNRGNFRGAYLYLDIKSGMLYAYWCRAMTGVTAALSLEAVIAESQVVSAVVISDDGPQFTSDDWGAMCAVKSVKWESMGAGSQHRNSVESRIQWIKKMSKAMMLDAPGLDKSFYPWSLNHAITLRNMSKGVNGKSPWKEKTGNDPPKYITRLIFGELCWIILKADVEKKGESIGSDEGRTVQGWYLGISWNLKGLVFIAAVPTKFHADGKPDWTRNYSIHRTTSCYPASKVYDIDLRREACLANDPNYLYKPKTFDDYQTALHAMSKEQAMKIVERIHPKGTMLCPANQYLTNRLRMTRDEKLKNEANEKVKEILDYTGELKIKRGEVGIGDVAGELEFVTLNEDDMRDFDTVDVERYVIAQQEKLQVEELKRHVDTVIRDFKEEKIRKTRLIFNGGKDDTIICRKADCEVCGEEDMIKARRTYANPSDAKTHEYPYLPSNVKDARKIPIWNDAVNVEYDGFKSRGIYKEVPVNEVPKGTKIIKILTIFDWKNYGEKAKVRSVVLGNYVVGYTGHKASPTPSSYIVRLVFAIFSYCKQMYRETGGKKWITVSFDVGQAFLEADMDVDIYCYPPDEFYTEGEKVVWLLKKALYGLPQCAWLWHLTMDTILKDYEMKQSQYNPCLYYKQEIVDGVLIEVLTIHVDDGLIAGVEELVKQLMEFIKSRLTKVKTFKDQKLYLGMQIAEDKDGNFFLYQEKMIEEALKELELEDEPGKLLPMRSDINLPHLQAGEGLVDSNYQKIIGIILYIVRMTHPEALFAATHLSRFNLHHGNEHLEDAKHLMLYLKTAKKRGIYLKADVNAQPLVLTVDASFRPFKEDPKLMSYFGYNIYFYGVLLTSVCKTIKRACLSSTHAEIIAMYAAVRDMKTILETIRELNIGPAKNSGAYLYVLIREDNQSCIKAVMNPLGTPQTRELSAELLYLRELRDRGDIMLDDESWITTAEMCSDIHTKPLARILFQKHASKMIRTIEEKPPTWLKPIPL